MCSEKNIQEDYDLKLVLFTPTKDITPIVPGPTSGQFDLKSTTTTTTTANLLLISKRQTKFSFLNSNLS